MAGTKENKSKLLKEWEGIKFRLYVPKVIDKDNKIEVHFTYTSIEGIKKQVKQSTGIDRYSKESVFTKDALLLVDACILMLQNGYNYITKSYPDHIKLHSKSTITDCIYYWLKLRQQDVEDGKMQAKGLETVTHIFDFFNSWLIKNHIQKQVPDYFTKNDINAFLRSVEQEREWGKATYNAYNHRLNHFWKFLISERVTSWNPVTDSFRYKLANVATRFQIYEDADLESVKTLMTNDKTFTDLTIATNLLYTYRIRGAEQLRIRVKYFDFEKNLLTIPTTTLDADNAAILSLKNGGSAKWELLPEDAQMIKDYIGKNIDNPDYFLFSGHNKSGQKQVNDEFLSHKFSNFRKKYNLSDSLKWYALKHTANYNASEVMTPEEQRILNRHSDIATTAGYKESKVKKQVIRVNKSHKF